MACRRLPIPWIPLVAALLMAACDRQPLTPTASGSATPVAFAEPPVLANKWAAAHVVEVDLAAAPAKLALLPGKPADVLAYNGGHPGPTLDVAEGDHVVVHFTNRLGEPTNVHWHGMHVPADQDGGPMDLVAPGASRDYAFDVPAGGAGTFWYHPHPHGATASQVGRGLFGAIRVRAAADPVPAAFQDTLLVLSDNRFRADGTIAPETHMDKMMGREGDVVFVNGQLNPTLAVHAGEGRRLRIVNASAARTHRLSLPGYELVQIGTDGGLFERPIARDELVLAPAERAEVLVRATGQPGSAATLVSTPDRRGMTVGAQGMPATLLTLAIGAEPSQEPPPFPSTLRPVRPLSAEKATTHTITFTEDHLTLDFRLDGRKFDPARPDIRAKLGATEVWKLVNQGDMDHPFHLHGFPFQVLDRNGVPEPFRTWKDTVNVPKDQAVRFVVRYDDYPGPRVYHCHVLEHEDQGMMGLLQIE